MVEIRRSALTQRVVDRGVRLGTDMKRLVGELCPQSAEVMAVNGSSGEAARGLRYMLGDNIREVILHVHKGRTRLGMLGGMVSMFAYANARAGSAAMRSWVMELAAAAGPSAKVVEAVREVLWFRALDGKEFAPRYGRKNSHNQVLYYRPPTLAVEAALTAWSLVL